MIYLVSDQNCQKVFFKNAVERQKEFFTKNELRAYGLLDFAGLAKKMLDLAIEIAGSSHKDTKPQKSLMKESTDESASKDEEECRACLVKSKFLKNLFDDSLAEAFTSCTGLIITQNDEISTSICHSCEILLLQAFEFYKNCRKSNATLKNRIVQKVVVEEIIEAPALNPSKAVDPMPVNPTQIFIKEESGDESLLENEDIDEFRTKEWIFDGENFKCRRCDKSFQTKYGIKRHEKFCGKSELEIMEMKRKRRRERPQKPIEDGPDEWECEVCHKMMKSRDSLKIHMTLHAEKKLSCETCGKLFPQLRYLRTHMLVHAEEKMFKCLNCNAAYTLNTSLRRHLRDKRECRIVHFGGEKVQQPKEEEETRMEDESQFGFEDFLADSDDEMGAKPELETEVAVKEAPERKKRRAEEPKEEVDESEFPYECDLCKKRFQQLRYVRQHMGVHKEYNRYKCLNCNANYSLGNSLNRHLKRHKDCRMVHYAGGKNVPKRNRDLILKDLNELMENPESITPKREFVFNCAKCDRKFDSAQMLKTHMHVHEDIKDLLCQKCEQSFTRHSALRNHWRENEACRPPGVKMFKKLQDSRVKEGEDYDVIYLPVENELKRRFSCKTCNHVMVHLRGIRSHVLNHKGIKAFVCSVQDCGKGFVTLFALKNHMNFHTGETPHKCRYCGQTYRASSTMRSHEEVCPRRNPAEVKTYLCPTCGRVCKSKTILRSHLVIHTGAKKYVCELCGKDFHRSSQLQAHRLLHSGIRRHKCEICSREFVHKKTLISHMITHSETPFRCHQCQVGFADPEELKAHREAMHKKERADKAAATKDHTCLVCGKSYSQSYFLRQHLLSHSDQKSFSCQYCPKTFKLAKSLQLHVHEHIGKPFKCQQCSKEFSWESGWKKHALKSHGINLYKRGRAKDENVPIDEGPNDFLIASDVLTPTHIQLIQQPHPIQQFSEIQMVTTDEKPTILQSYMISYQSVSASTSDATITYLPSNN